MTRITSKSKKLKYMCALATSLLAFGLSSSAFATPKLAVGPRISTIGGGIDVATQVNDYFNVRMQVNGFKYKTNVDDEDLSYTARLQLFTVGPIVDYHPFKSGFFVSAGALYNNNKLSLKATPGDDVTLDGVTYTPQQIGQVNGSLTFKNRVSPYFGIGYDSAFHKKGNFSLGIDLGVLYQGKPKGDVTLTGTAAGNAALRASIKRDAEDAANKSFIRFLPGVVNIWHLKP